MCSAGVLNLLHLNAWYAFCMCSRFHVLWNLNTCRTQKNVFKCDRFKTPAKSINFLSPTLETFIKTIVVFSCTNIILNPQRLGQSKITWYVSWAYKITNRKFSSRTLEMNSWGVWSVLRNLQCEIGLEVQSWNCKQCSQSGMAKWQTASWYESIKTSIWFKMSTSGMLVL